MKVNLGKASKVIVLLLAVLLIVVGCSSKESTSSPTPDASKTDPIVSPVVSDSHYTVDLVNYTPPSLDDVPEGPVGEAIKYGYQLINETNTLLPDNVGNQLSCSSCHGNAGLDSTSPLTGVTAVYPMYIARAGKVLTIEDRINGCFQRSMNGSPLEYNSKEMQSMVAYLTYISTGVPVGIEERPWITKNDLKKDEVPEPNIENGEKLYNQACMQCHAADGSGLGPNVGPALWGENSFNIGAGMARLSKATAYIQRNMPLGSMGGINQGELTVQEAADIAAYILSQDRPDFAKKAGDWPLGGAPWDVPYEVDSNKK